MFFIIFILFIGKQKINEYWKIFLVKKSFFSWKHWKIKQKWTIFKVLLLQYLLNICLGVCLTFDEIINNILHHSETRQTIQIPRISNVWVSMTGFCSQHVTLHPQLTVGSSARWCKALGGCLPLPGLRGQRWWHSRPG